MPSLGKGDDSEGAAAPTWGFVHPPNINEQVVVIGQNGDFTNGYVIGAMYSNKIPPPDPDGTKTEMGEFLWCHKTGSYIKFHNNGDITVVTAEDLNVHVGRNANVLIEGSAVVEAKGDITFFVTGNATVVGDSAVTAYAQSLTANVYGAAAVNASGAATVNAGGDITALANGNVTVGANGDAVVTTQGALEVVTRGGINLVTPASINLIAGGKVNTVEGATVPPPNPIIIPPLPDRPIAPDLLPLFHTETTISGVTPIPAPTTLPPGQGAAPGITGLTAANPTSNGLDLQFNAPTGA
jgi:phage baseplate assembly protein gpV